MQLYTKILIGLALGVVVGLFANVLDIGWLRSVLVELEVVGTAWINLIFMIVVPLVVASLMVGTASLGDLSKLGRLGGKTILYYVCTTAVAVTIGLVISNVVQPGAGVDEETRAGLEAQFEGEAGEFTQAAEEEAPTITDQILAIIPDNPIRAAADLDLLPLIFFTLIFAAAITLIAPERRDAIITFFDGVNDACMVLVGWFMKLAPFAVFFLIAAVIAQFGLGLLQSLLFYALTVVAGLLLHATITYGFVVKFLARLPFLQFLKRIINAPVVAFSTSSSAATLPVTMETAEKNVGVSKPVSSFVLPLGATVNMDGTALYQAVAVMFIAQIYGIPLGFVEQLTIVLTATLASIGAAGVPSAGIIMLIIVLNAVGLGPQVQAGIALILGVDRILDMIRTATNVTGDLSGASFIARTEGDQLSLEPLAEEPAVAGGTDGGGATGATESAPEPTAGTASGSPEER